MKRYKYSGTGNNGTFSWVMQRISALVLLVVVFYHFFGMITGAYDGMIRFVLGCALAFGTWHAVNGLKMITDDYVSSRGLRAALLIFYWVVGIIVLIQGLSILP